MLQKGGGGGSHSHIFPRVVIFAPSTHRYQGYHLVTLCVESRRCVGDESERFLDLNEGKAVRGDRLVSQIAGAAGGGGSFPPALVIQDKFVHRTSLILMTRW